MEDRSQCTLQGLEEAQQCILILRSVCCVITCTNGGSQPFSSLYSPPATRHILLICTLHPAQCYPATCYPAPCHCYPAPCILLPGTLHIANQHPSHCYPAPFISHTALVHPAHCYPAYFASTHYTLLHPTHIANRCPAPFSSHMLYCTLHPAHCYPASFIQAHYYNSATYTHCNIAPFTLHDAILHPCILCNTTLFILLISCTQHFTRWYTVKNAVELFFAFHPDVEKIQYH